MEHTLKLTLPFILILASCADNSHQDDKNTPGDTTPLTETTKKSLHTLAETSPNSDTLIIDSPSAVFIQPDSFRIEKRIKEIGEEFYTGAGDYLFYMSAAHEFLDSVKLRTIETKDTKFVKFICSDKTQQIIKLNELPELWSIYFFDPTKKAKQVDMTVIAEEYESYFK